MEVMQPYVSLCLDKGVMLSFSEYKVDVLFIFQTRHRGVFFPLLPPFYSDALIWVTANISSPTVDFCLAT